MTALGFSKIRWPHSLVSPSYLAKIKHTCKDVAGMSNVCVGGWVGGGGRISLPG